MNKLTITYDVYPDADIADNDSAVEYNAVEFKLFVDSVPLIVSDYHTDVWTVMAICGIDYDFNLCVCGCGDAGCAGIFNRIRQTVNENIVNWRIPAEWYAQNINPLFVFNNNVLELQFELGQVKSEIARVISEIDSVVDKTKGLVIMPESCAADNVVMLNIADYHSKSKASARSWADDIARNKERYGKYYNSLLNIEYSNFKLCLDTEYLLWHIAASLPNVDNPRDYIDSTILPSLLNDSEYLTVLLGMLPVSELSDLVYDGAYFDVCEVSKYWPPSNTNIQLTYKD